MQRTVHDYLADALSRAIDPVAEPCRLAFSAIAASCCRYVVEDRIEDAS
jgi:hypothetical protein